MCVPGIQYVRLVVVVVVVWTAAAAAQNILKLRTYSLCMSFCADKMSLYDYI